MSDYGPLPGPPQGAPFGGPSAAVKPSDSSAPQVAMLTYVAGGLGLLGFVWGFLDWLSADVGDAGVSGFASIGGAAIGLLLVAGLLAAATTFEEKELTLAPAAVSTAALLVTFGMLVDHEDGAGVGVGLVLAFITAIVQAAALVVAWLLTSGKMSRLGGGSSPSGPGSPRQEQFGQFVGYPGEPGPYGGPPPGYGTAPGGPPGYGPPPQGLPPQGLPPQGPPPQAPPPQGPPPGYGPPPQPSFPQGPPAGYGPPPAQPPQSPSDSRETQVNPIYNPGPPAESGDQHPR